MTHDSFTNMYDCLGESGISEVENETRLRTADDGILTAPAAEFSVEMIVTEKRARSKARVRPQHSTGRVAAIDKTKRRSDGEIQGRKLKRSSNDGLN